MSFLVDSLGIFGTMCSNDSLYLFELNARTFFSKKCLIKPNTKDEVPNFVRKNVKNFTTLGDFSVSRNILQDDKNYLNLVAQELVKESTGWPLHVIKSAIIVDHLAIFLERQHAFELLIRKTIQSSQLLGQQPKNSQTVLVTSDVEAVEEINLDLSSFRVLLLKKASSKLFSLMGYNIGKVDPSVNENQLEFHFSSCTPNRLLVPLNSIQSLCAPVLDTRNGGKTCTMASEYLLLRLADIKAITEYRYRDRVSEKSQFEDMSCIRDAAVIMDLLGTRPNHTVSINFDPECVRSRQSSSKGAPFIMYNYARIAAIQDQFRLKVSEGVYPALVQIGDVDFSLLTKEEEWELMFNYILVYPSVIRESMERCKEGVVRVDLLCKFLSALCSSFSGYYRRVRILTESRAHLLPVMFARLYLLKAIEQVINNALHVLDIKPVAQM